MVTWSPWTQKVHLCGDFPLALSGLKLTSRWTSWGVLGPIQLLAIPCKQTTTLVANHQCCINIVLHVCSLRFWERFPLFGMKDCQTEVKRMHIYYVLQPTSVHQWAWHGPNFETISQFQLKRSTLVFPRNATKQIDGVISLHIESTMGNCPMYPHGGFPSKHLPKLTKACCGTLTLLHLDIR